MSPPLGFPRLRKPIAEPAQAEGRWIDDSRRQFDDCRTQFVADTGRRYARRPS
jgi:hypothetical protein